MSPAPLELVPPGSLSRPGPIGRSVRFVLGAACLYALVEVLRWAEHTTIHPWSTLDNRLVMLAVPLCTFNYVVNIGFGRSWGHGPLIVSLAVLTLAAALSLVLAGTADHPLLGVPLNVWLSYSYGHLGLSFVLAAITGAPGCEMRSLPELIGRIAGRPAAEHRCPAAFIHRLDEWERGRRGV